MNPLPKRGTLTRRAVASATGLALVGLPVALIAPAAHAADPVWTFQRTTLDTGVSNGYQLAMDKDNRKVWLSDAKWRTETKQTTYDNDGNPTGYTIVPDAGTGKVVQFDSEKVRRVGNKSFLNLTRQAPNGTTPLRENQAFDWTGVTGTSQSSIRTTFSPYGVAVDGKTTNAAGDVDPTIITTTARAQDPDVGFGGSVVVFNASQSAPTDADRLFEFGEDKPMFDGIRRIAVNTVTHTAFVTNMGDRSATPNPARPGFIGVIDLESKQVVARVKLPGQVIGVAADEENDRIFVGLLNTPDLYEVDTSNLDTSNPESFDLNDDKVTKLDATVGANSRPTYDPVNEKVYVSSFGTNTVSVVEANDGANHGELIKAIPTGPTNSVEVDTDRGILYSANLGDQEVVGFDINDDYNQVLALPTSGNAVNVGIDPVTHDVWVSNFSSVGKVDVFHVTTPDEQPEPVGPGDQAIYISFGKVKVSNKTMTVKVPAAGKIKAVMKAKKKVIGKKTVTATKKGKKTFTVKLNKAGKKLKKQGKKVPVTVEVTYKAAK